MYPDVSRYPARVPEVHDLQSIGKIIQGELVHSLVGSAALAHSWQQYQLHFETNHEAPDAYMATHAGLGML